MDAEQHQQYHERDQHARSHVHAEPYVRRLHGLVCAFLQLASLLKTGIGIIQTYYIDDRALETHFAF